MDVPLKGLYECKAKGSFRNQSIKPLPGDHVLIDVLDEEKKLGNISDILERRNILIRPAVANVDQALVVFAVAEPNPNLGLLDRFLLIMQKQQIPVILCFNKTDLDQMGMEERLKKTYGKSGALLFFISTKQIGFRQGIQNHLENISSKKEQQEHEMTESSREEQQRELSIEENSKEEQLQELRDRLHGRITVFAGPSGVGKSSLLNVLNPEADVKTGAISEKIKRGKHTTRHSELMQSGENTYLIDTPGFSTLYLDLFTKEELKDYYPEFEAYNGKCRFIGCFHIHEPECAVKQAVENREISKLRYQNYVSFYKELEEKEKHLY